MNEMFLEIKNSEELSSEDRFILGILFILYLIYKENDKVLLLYNITFYCNLFNKKNQHISSFFVV